MNTNIASLLLRDSRLGEQEWFDFLESVRKEINPYLDKFTLKSFGDLACMNDNTNRYRMLSDDNPEVIGDIPLHTHGISYFRDSGEHLVTIGSFRIMHAWGLSKSGKWVLIEITVVLTSEKRQGQPLERAKKVLIFETSLSNMIKFSQITPRSVWDSIVLEVAHWKAKRKLSYEDVCRTASRFEYVDKMLNDVAILSKK